MYDPILSLSKRWGYILDDSRRTGENTILIIDKRDIADYISSTTDIPVADLQVDEFTILDNLSKKLNRKVISIIHDILFSAKFK